MATKSKTKAKVKKATKKPTKTAKKAAVDASMKLKPNSEPAMVEGLKEHQVLLQNPDGTELTKGKIAPFANFPHILVHKGEGFRFWANENGFLVYRKATVIEMA